jgi:hypothetical protein
MLFVLKYSFTRFVTVGRNSCLVVENFNVLKCGIVKNYVDFPQQLELDQAGKRSPNP